MSVFTELAAEGIILAGGGRAILLQIANPAVGYGVAAHSDFANRPVERLTNTVSYAYATVFATPDELAAVVRRVNHAHGPVVSRIGETDEYHRATETRGGHPAAGETRGGHPADAGEHPQPGGAGGAGGATGAPGATVAPSVSFNAFDTESQLWVAATLYQTAITVYEKTFGQLAPADAEDVYRRYGVLGSALQMPPELWPADVAAFAAYWERAVGALQVTDAARRVASDLLHPRTAPLWLKAAMPVVRLVTTGLLDEELRRAFVLPWNARSQRQFDRLFSVLRIVYPRLPRSIRHLPRDRYMRALRASLQLPTVPEKRTAREKPAR